MESKKPLGIAIPALRADAFLLTRTLSGSFSSGSFPIRAPLTIDDDDDSGSVSDEHDLAISDASIYSRGIDSDIDDGFESVSGEVEDETELEDATVDGIRVHRLLGEELGGETGDVSDSLGESVIYRPFAGDVGEETFVNYSSFEEESENSDEVEGISESEVSEDDGVSLKAKVIIPRVILSMDDDEFDEILGSDGEEDVLLAPGIVEAEEEVRALQFGEMGTVEKPECSDSGIGDFDSTKEEVVEMNYSDKLDYGLRFFGNIEEHSLAVPPGGCDDIMVENEENSVEASVGSGGTFEQPIEKGVLQRSIINDGGGGIIHEVDALLKPGDVEGVEDSAVELRGSITDKPECSGSVRCDFVSSEKDMVQLKFSDSKMASFETTEGNILTVATGDCNDFQVESEENVVGETVSHLFKQGVGQGSISKENDNRTDVGSAYEVDAVMILDDGSIGLVSTESGDEGIGNIIGEAKECWENDCSTASRLEKLEWEGEPEIGMSSESFQSTPTLDSVTSTNLHIAEGVVCVSATNLKLGQESEDERNQEPQEVERKSLFPNEDSALNLRSSSETAADEQIVSFQCNSEPDQISVDIEKTTMLSVEAAETIMPENSSVIACDIMNNETRIAPLINNQISMELDEYEGTGKSRGKLSPSTFQNDSEELSYDHSIQLISEKVKERVEKTQFLKAKLQRIIKTIGFCSDSSAVTEVVSELSLAGGEHQTSLGLDYVSDGTKILLPEPEGQNDLDFSINVLVIGKTGVGKSATINSIFGETKSPVGAFGVTTKSVNCVVGNVGGIVVRILDTPGLMSSATKERFNQELLMSIKKSMRTFPVDVILYINRLDENPDIHLHRIITSSLGSSVWGNTIVVLTHAASNLPDSSSYKDFISQRCSLMHKSIRPAVPELSCVDQSKMPRILLAENNISSSYGNKTSESTYLDWRLNLLILCCSAKIRSRASSLQMQNAVIEKTDVCSSQLRSLTLFCSLWNVLLLGDNSGHTCHSHDDLEEKKRQLLDSYTEILWDEQSQECLEQETSLVENQDEERRYEQGKTNKGLEEGTVLGLVRTRRGRFGFQVTKRFGIYLDTSKFSMGNDEEEGRILVKMRGSMSVLGLVPMLMSVLTSLIWSKRYLK